LRVSILEMKSPLDDLNLRVLTRDLASYER